jgi:hypothetical protein
MRGFSTEKWDWPVGVGLCITGNSAVTPPCPASQHMPKFQKPVWAGFPVSPKPIKFFKNSWFSIKNSDSKFTNRNRLAGC